MSRTILIVDDKEELRTMLEAYLSQEGYRVVTATDGQHALYVARYEKPDLVLLDLMMPNMDGYDFIRAYSREAETPIIILTARLDEGDKVLGLEMGADDYVTKPFSPRELAARVRAVIRRAEREPSEPEVLRAADITLDRGARTVRVGTAPVDLTPTEFELLATVMRQPGRTFTRAELLDQLQGGSFEAYERTIDVHVRNLRTKVEPDPRNPRYIETVYGVGYRFALDG